VLIGFGSDRLCGAAGAAGRPPSRARAPSARERLSQLRRMWALLVAGGGAGFAGLGFVLTSIHHWLVNPERNVALVLVPIGLVSIVIGMRCWWSRPAVYILGRNRMRTRLRAFPRRPAGLSCKWSPRTKFTRGVGASYTWRHSSMLPASETSMTLPQDITARLQSEMSAAVREHWKAFLIEGILLVVLGSRP
jgi:hypothetical protein